jgi:quaternary ammonium compound-resistance protein SugE
LGTVGTIAIGVIFWGDPINLLKVFFVFLMIIGIIGLKIIPEDSHDPKEQG